MSRSPLAYPLARGIDTDGGGAADLQTDVMRFMAILALCLVAIFALVQSIPLAPLPSPEAPAPAAAAPEPIEALATAVPETIETEPPSTPETGRSVAEPVLMRPKWQPKFPVTGETRAELAVTEQRPASPAETPTPADNVPPAPPAPEGFTLRFASDLALTRLVAEGKVAFYALQPGRARRLAVSESRLSFWDASMPNTFHEMEAATVPRAVIDAHSRVDGDAEDVQWGVTLPKQLSDSLDRIMQAHAGGALVITPTGELVREAG